MPQTYIAFGDPIEGRAPDEFSVKAARETWRVIEARREFTFVEVRRVASDGGVAEALVVDCKNDEVATRNRVGIRYCERLALIFYTNPERQPEVRALRNGFPVTAHQNYVVAGEPPSLCLYFEPWSRVRRSWTPQFHLNRILWWLAETANGTLHRPDQPLEQLYFDSPFELVLLWDFRAKIADPNYQLAIRSHKERELKATLIGQMIDRGGSVSGAVGIACLALTVPPIVHGRVEAFPATLGALDDQFQRRGAALIEGLADQIRGRCRAGRFEAPASGLTLLVLSVPLQREPGALPEETIEIGFVLNRNVAELGVTLGVLEKVDSAGLGAARRAAGSPATTYLEMNIIGGRTIRPPDWRDVTVSPLTVVPAFTPEEGRRMAGLADGGPVETLAGFGALGSQMLNLWLRSGWGRWTVIDPDWLRPHNLARHVALECHNGVYKAHAAMDLANLLFTPQAAATQGIVGRADDLAVAPISEALEGCDIVVDVSTDLSVPRTIAGRENIKRALSAFITPSGLGAVMLVEDDRRVVRLDALEAQYYRRVISEAWGTTHLAGLRKEVWTGAGCRDLSAVIPSELIALHAANLALTTRVRLARPDGGVLI